MAGVVEEPGRIQPALIDPLIWVSKEQDAHCYYTSHQRSNSRQIFHCHRPGAFRRARKNIRWCARRDLSEDELS